MLEVDRLFGRARESVTKMGEKAALTFVRLSEERIWGGASCLSMSQPFFSMQRLVGIDFKALENRVKTFVPRFTKEL